MLPKSMFVVVALLGGAFVLEVAVTAAGAMGTSPSSVVDPAVFACTPAGPIVGLSPVQAGNAETVVAVTETMAGGSPSVAQVAVMAAYTESRLDNLGSQAGTDSLGLFQQRVSQGWGTSAQEENPAEATSMFVSALLGVAGWAAMTPWIAAQDVQRSEFSDGSNYRGNWGVAGRIVSQVDRLDTGAACGELLGAVPAGPPARFGLPLRYTIPAIADPAETAAISYALAQLGKPYVWGAAGPEAFDCSGLTMMAWAAAGVALDHYTLDQLTEGTPVADLSMISPGDLVLIPGSDGTLAAPGHVGIYIGDGLVESAVDPAEGVIVQTWASFTTGGLSGIRHIA